MGRSGYTCIRYTLCTSNVLVWLVGCGMLGVGIWLHLAYGRYATVVPAYSSLSADSLCIIAGVATFVIAFFGCCGSWFQNRCLLIMYFTLVALVFALEVTAGTLAFIYRNDVKDSLKDEFLTGIKKHYGKPEEEGFTSAWDHIQRELDCCGVFSPKDWYDIDRWTNETRVPDSCCDTRITNKTGCGLLVTEGYIHSKGCFDKLHVWIIERLHVAGIIVLVFAFVQLFGLVSSILIYCTLRHRNRKWSS